jgi:hypothetical protein
VTETTSFNLQLSNFSYVIVKHKISPVKKLRFTLIATFDHPEHGALGMGWDGCLAHRNSDDLLVWSPPLSKINPYKALKTGWINETLYDLVTATLSKSPYIAELGKEGWTEEDRTPRVANPELPEYVNV